MHLRGRLVNQGEQHIEGDTVRSQQLVGSIIHGVGEVAGKDGSNMQQGTATRVGTIYLARQTMRQRLYGHERCLARCLHEERHLTHIYRTFLAEGLQRVQYAITCGSRLAPNIHGHATGSVEEERSAG